MTQPSNPLPAEVPIRRHHIRAPRGDGETLITPPLASAHPTLEANRNRRGAAYNFTRYEFLKAANEYSRSYRDFSPSSLDFSSETPIVLAGHQPELFHPGVWLKNFVLDRCREIPNQTEHQATTINLVIDNDVALHTSIRIPTGDLHRPLTEELAIDAPAPAIPFEERQIASPDVLNSFDSRLRKAFDSRKWFQRDTSLLVEKLWHNHEAEKILHKSLPLGLLLAQTRHRLEAELGLQTLELPLSHVAQTESFRKFALDIFSQLPHFQEIYNRSLAEYRAVNKIRSASHPVPELVAEGDWLEAPFWIWTKEGPFRRRLFVRNVFVASGDLFLQFTDRAATNFDLHCSLYDPETLVEQLQDLESRGIKIRPRALITTMYARLYLSDLFIHGIGGAKYDELTDAIIRRYFDSEPPTYMTVTGTVKLPIPRPDVSAADVLNAKQLIREIRFHPEKFAGDASPALRTAATEFASKKAELLRQHQFHFRGAAPEQFRALDDLNRQLQLLLTDVEIRLRDELKDRERDLHTAKILGSREFSFVLHPLDTLPDQLKRMASSS
ncbi:hypothetical protein [Anatilimnocola floriformis]|uniref:hypothetical protein n=1 Tax=Anatilimnocola floriformis TaxID=2948575 RepID=UPI0020C288D1|nr:hypothetical protein [Anatilimnocola floriformis]